MSKERKNEKKNGIKVRWLLFLLLCCGWSNVCLLFSKVYIFFNYLQIKSEEHWKNTENKNKDFRFGLIFFFW